MPPDGFATSYQPDLFRPETWTSAASATFSRETSQGTANATFSPALVGGATPVALLGGLTSAPSGPARRRASPGASRAPGREQKMPAISGLRCAAYPVPAGPLSSWESRLQTRLARDGLTVWPATWRPAATPSGLSFSRLVASGRSTAGTGFILWPTPAARDYRAPNNPNGASRGNRPPKSGKQLPNEIVAHLGGITDSNAGATGSLGWLNPEFACWLMGYPPEWVLLAPSEMPSSRSSQPR